MKKTSLLMKKEIARVQPIVAEDLAASRKSQDRVGELMAKALANKVTYMPVEGLENTELAIPAEGRNDALVIYLHGGAYTAGDLAYAKGFGGVLADSIQIPVLCVGYRLAPENPYPAALEDALAAYRAMLLDYDPGKIVFAGESAGGGLCFGACLAAIDEGMPPPRCIVAISPWTDLTLSFDAHRRNASEDPTLSTQMLDLSADMYAGDRRDIPYVSPVFGDLRGMPDSIIFAGTSEILEDDGTKMAKRLEAAGAHCTLHVEQDAWHAYVLYGIFEAREALAQIKEFITERL